MAVTLQDLIDNNNTSLTALNQSLAQLMRLRAQGPPASQLISIIAQIATTQADITTGGMIDAHLKAASTTVQPIAPADEEQLDHLAQTLDNTIKANTLANASLAFIRSVVDDAESLQQTTLAHT